MKRFQVTVNGNRYQVEVEELSAGQAFATPVVSAPVLQPVAAAPVAATPISAPVEPVAAPVPASSGNLGADKVNAPMQGKIVGIKVAVGDVVKVNDVVAVLEAMKMENEIVSPFAGTVSSVNIQLGQTVQTADLLISLN